MKKTVKQVRRGFTLIESLVVVLIIGALAAIALPQYFQVIEKAHFAEALSCIGTIRAAEERAFPQRDAYVAQTNLAMNPSTPLDTDCPAMKYFTGSVATNGAGYIITLTRNGFSVPSGILKNYAVTMAINGPGAAPTYYCQSTCANWLPPTGQLEGTNHPAPPLR